MLRSQAPLVHSAEGRPILWRRCDGWPICASMPRMLISLLEMHRSARRRRPAIQLIGRYSAHRRSGSTGTRLDGMVRRAEQGELNHGARSGAPMDRPQTARWSATIELIVARNRWFESISLHRRVRKLSRAGKPQC
jgi:hypothetical protein